LFGVNNYLEGNVKKITCSLHKIVAFIRQRKLDNNITNDISQIAEFSLTTGNFILSIYESGWDKLKANKNDNVFRQSVASQFKIKSLINNLINYQDSSKLSSQAKISKVPFLILSRPSKSILAK